ncbi:MAG: DUF2069 domain-containing protein [Burkholderiales bacterium]|nr:DUF2069 domain-containing protein [Burkholderiales bacterium]
MTESATNAAQLEALVDSRKATLYQRSALFSLIALIVLCLLWETVLAPLRPGGSWLALKALPLLLPLSGIYKRNIYTMQWSSMVILLYFTEGVVRGSSDLLPLSRQLAWGEAGLVTLYFLASILYVRPYKKAAKALAKQALLKARQTPEATPQPQADTPT